MLILELEQSFSWKLDCGNNRVASDSLSKKCPKFYPHGNKLKFGSSRVGFHPPLPQTQCWGVCMCACLFFCCCGPLSSPLFQHCFQGEGRNETELKFVAELTACYVFLRDVFRGRVWNETKLKSVAELTACVFRGRGATKPNLSLLPSWLHAMYSWEMFSGGGCETKLNLSLLPSWLHAMSS